ncbi:hypothetical protein ACP275_03G037600 [Erythranthe tilingii]
MSLYIQYLCGVKGVQKELKKNVRLLKMNNNESSFFFFSKKTYRSDENVRKNMGGRPFINIVHFDKKKCFFLSF